MCLTENTRWMWIEQATKDVCDNVLVASELDEIYLTLCLLILCVFLLKFFIINRLRSAAGSEYV